MYAFLSERDRRGNPFCEVMNKKIVTDSPT